MHEQTRNLKWFRFLVSGLTSVTQLLRCRLDGCQHLKRRCGVQTASGTTAPSGDGSGVGGVGDNGCGVRSEVVCGGSVWWWCVVTVVVVVVTCGSE